MVCENCQKKLGKLITPDKWKAGARNTLESGGRKLNENKALTKKKVFFSICRICRSKAHQKGSHYCQDCVFKKSICAMCGKKLMSNKSYASTSAQSIDYLSKILYN